MAVKGKGEQTERLKIVVRKLPADLPESVFWASVSEYVLPYDYEGEDQRKLKWSQYRPGKVRKSEFDDLNSICYLYFHRLEQLLQFNKFYGHWQFNHKATNKFTTVNIQFATNQKIPSLNHKLDARQGTITQDQDYILYLEALTNPVPPPPLVAAEKFAKPTTTPLLDHLRQQKLSQITSNPTPSSSSNRTSSSQTQKKKSTSTKSTKKSNDSDSIKSNTASASTEGNRNNKGKGKSDKSRGPKKPPVPLPPPMSSFPTLSTAAQLPALTYQQTQQQLAFSAGVAHVRHQIHSQLVNNATTKPSSSVRMGERKQNSPMRSNQGPSTRPNPAPAPRITILQKNSPSTNPSDSSGMNASEQIAQRRSLGAALGAALNPVEVAKRRAATRGASSTRGRGRGIASNGSSNPPATM